MIKVNVEVNNKPWHKKIQNPQRYFNKKLKKIPKIVPFFKRKNVTFTIFLTNSFPNLPIIPQTKKPPTSVGLYVRLYLIL